VRCSKKSHTNAIPKAGPLRRSLPKGSGRGRKKSACDAKIKAGISNNRCVLQLTGEKTMCPGPPIVRKTAASKEKKGVNQIVREYGWETRCRKKEKIDIPLKRQSQDCLEKKPRGEEARHRQEGETRVRPRKVVGAQGAGEAGLMGCGGTWE